MKKMSKVVKPMIGLGLVGVAYYYLNKNKKNMLDVIIEEIETMK